MQEFKIPYYSGAVQSFGGNPAKREPDIVSRPICSQELSPVKSAVQGAVLRPLTDRRMFAEGMMADRAGFERVRSDEYDRPASPESLNLHARWPPGERLKCLCRWRRLCQTGKAASRSWNTRKTNGPALARLANLPTLASASPVAPNRWRGCRLAGSRSCPDAPAPPQLRLDRSCGR